METKDREYRTVRAVAFWFIPTWVWLIFGNWIIAGEWWPLFAALQILCIIALAGAFKEIWKK